MSTPRALAPFVLALSMLTTLARDACAQPSDADKATARPLATEGFAALEQKDYVTAADRLGRAEGIVHAPTHLLGIARAQVGLGRWVSAQETYVRIAREGAAPGAPAAFVKAVEEARVELAVLAPRVPSVVIDVKGAANAAVSIDGAPVPSAALGVKRPVDPGSHVIRASADGFAPAAATITSTEGRSSSVTLELKPAAAGAAAAGPATGSSAASGRKVGGIVALSVGGALVATGAVMLVLDLTSSSPASDDPCNPTPPDSSSPPYGIVSAITFAAGGAGIITGAVLLATLPKTQAPASVSVAPLVGPRYLGVRGSF